MIVKVTYLWMDLSMVTEQIWMNASDIQMKDSLDGDSFKKCNFPLCNYESEGDCRLYVTYNI